MRIFNLLKRKPEKPKILSASAVLYPNKILIETIDRAKAGYGVTSKNLTVLSCDSSDEEIGTTLRKHLSLTKINVPNPTDFKKNYAEYLVLAGFKTNKEFHKDALLLMVSLKGDIITLQPTINGGSIGKNRGFLGNKDLQTFSVPTSSTNHELGVILKQAWSECRYNGA